jgi:DNA-binding LytR/AlgR family response regulator
LWLIQHDKVLQNKFLTLSTLKAIEEQLPATKFLRIQKSFIVAIDKIQSIVNNEVIMGTHKIPVSRNYKEELMKLVNDHLIKK